MPLDEAELRPAFCRAPCGYTFVVVDPHMRDLLEADFEVAVVRDAVAAPKISDGDGCLAALINYRFMANGVWSTDETVAKLLAAAG